MTDWDAETASALNDEPVELSEEEIALATGQPVGLAPLILVVIGSTSFDEPFVVQSVLLGWGRRHADHQIYLWTTGAPAGAEAEAKIFAHANGWQTVEVQPETLLTADDAAVTFAFVTPGSRAAELAADIAQRRPVRQLTLETLRPRSRWNEW